MKKCYSLLRWPCWVTGCAQQTRLLFKTNRAAVAPKETITHHFFVSGIGQKKLVDAQNSVAVMKMLLKQKPSKIRKWIARFYYFRHLYSAWKRVLSSLIA